VLEAGGITQAAALAGNQTNNPLVCFLFVGW